MAGIDRVVRVATVATGFGLAGWLGLAGPLAAGGGSEGLTPGWDDFPGLTSGSVAWSIAPGSTTFEATYTLDGAEPNQQRQLGFHHFDAISRITIGSTAIKTGSGPPSETTREGHTSVVDSDEIGFLTTDANGDASQLVTLAGSNPGVYGVQFHVRQGGAPGCPTTSCNAIYRTGGAFADQLVRFAVPGAVAFWSGDDGDENDELGDAELVWSGSEGYRAAHFRDGFELAGGAFLSVPDPATHGLTSTSGFTVSAWVELDTASAGAAIVNLRTPANSSGYTLEMTVETPGKLQFVVNTDGTLGGWSTLDATGFPISTRFHVAASYDAASDTMRLYRDGRLIATRSDVAGSSLFLTGAEQMEIGRHVPAGYALDGALDELLYFDVALPPGAISAFAGFTFADGFESGGTSAWSSTTGGG
jgi:hypothetical protein